MIILVLAAVLIVMMAMNGVIFYILRTAVRTTEHQVREHFARQMTVFEGTVEEKQRESRELDEQLSDMKKEASDMKEIIDVLKSSPFYKPHKSEGEKLVPLAHYVDKQFFENYRIAKDMLAVLDKKKIIEQVQSLITYTGDAKRYKLVSKLLKTLDFNTVYELETVSGERQLQVLDEALQGEQHELFIEYVKGLKDPLSFRIMEFTDYLRVIQSANDPTLYIYTGDKDDRFGEDNGEMKVLYDSNICEGLRLVYQDQVYDYSICR